jgi:hypothetical protein
MMGGTGAAYSGYLSAQEVFLRACQIVAILLKTTV